MSTAEERIDAMAAQLRERKNAEGGPLYPESLINKWLVYQRAGQYGRANRLLRKAVRGPGLDRRGLCGARTRVGGTCIRSPVPNRKRCRFHGGATTGPKGPNGEELPPGPKTEAGRERCREAALRRWADVRARRAAQVESQN